MFILRYTQSGVQQPTIMFRSHKCIGDVNRGDGGGCDIHLYFDPSSPSSNIHLHVTDDTTHRITFYNNNNNNCHHHHSHVFFNFELTALSAERRDTKRRGGRQDCCRAPSSPPWASMWRAGRPGERRRRNPEINNRSIIICNG